MSSTETKTTSPLVYARVAGVLYLLLLPLGIIGILYVPTVLIVPGDAGATAHNIMAVESLYRLTIVAALIIPLVNLFVVLFLYKLLKHVNKNMAVLMVIFLLLAIPIAMLNELNQFAVLLLLSGAEFLTVFTAVQLQAFATFFLELHKYGIHIAGIFWGLWLFPMGYLVFKSGFLPRILGILLMIGCFGYLIDSFAAFLVPEYGVAIAGFTFWGELLLPLWLLIKGVNVERWEKVALEST